jgi:hypothetical protein
VRHARRLPRGRHPLKWTHSVLRDGTPDAHDGRLLETDLQLFLPGPHIAAPPRRATLTRAQVTCLVLYLVFVIPVQHRYARNVVSFVRAPLALHPPLRQPPHHRAQVIFHSFLQYVNYSREMVRVVAG